MEQSKYAHSLATAFMVIFIVFGTYVPVSYAELSSHVYVKAQSLTLKEYDKYGEKTIEEEGALLGIGYKLIPKLDATSLSGDGELFYGIVDYDGQLRNGDAVDEKNKYIGVNLHGNLNFLLFESFLEEESLMAITGLGIDCWSRSMNLIHKENGYREIWTNFYGRAGVGFYLLKNVYFSGGVKIPFWTKRHIGDFNLNLNPKGKMGAFIETTILLDHISMDLFFESNKFVKSDMESGKSNQYNGWQPELKGQTIGVSFRSNF
jgi:hypothetical protein